MDGHNQDRGFDRMGPPAGLLETLKARDSVGLALRIASDLHSLMPLDVPSLPITSDALAELLDSHTPATVPEHLRAEHRAYTDALLARAGAKADNRLRLRSGLWAEQTLRAHNRPEHARLRAHHRDVWGVNESAARDPLEREQQVQAHA